MKTLKMPVNKLTPADYNPRKISDEALQGLTKSLERFGYVEPIIYNARTERIIGGHQRVKALQNIGQKEAEVVVVDLDEHEEKALNLSLNNAAIQGEWDSEKLNIVLEELRCDFADYDDLKLDELELETNKSANTEEDITFRNEPTEKKGERGRCPKCGFEWER